MSNMTSQTQDLPGPPYPPTNAALGGIPTVTLDVPLAAVFLVLFITGAVGHMTIYKVNKKRGHKFFMSAMLFGFCMARIFTMIMRIVWSCYPTDIHVEIAAQIFVAAGVILVFIINLIFAQRLVRALHPRFGWHPVFSIVFKILYILIPLMLAMLITVTVQSFYTLDQRIKTIDHNVQLGGQTYLLFVAFLPIPVVLGTVAVPRLGPLEKFGTGRFRSKVVALLLASALLSTGAGFRVGTNFMPETPVNNPPWYFAKAYFWIFNFTLELIVVYTYLIIRVDKRFWVPNKSRSFGGYWAAYGAQRPKETSPPSSTEGSTFERAILSEEEVFDLQAKDGDVKDDEEKCHSCGTPIESPKSRSVKSASTRPQA